MLPEKFKEGYQNPNFGSSWRQTVLKEFQEMREKRINE
jgi:hypothetical protein